MWQSHGAWRGGVGLAAALVVTLMARAQEAPTSSLRGMARLVQNPLAEAGSLAFTNDTQPGQGPYRQPGNILNLQPAMPFRLGEEWSLVTRASLPLVSRGRLSPQDAAVSGLGNVVGTAVLTPARTGPWVWGLGPTFSLPSGTVPHLAPRQWAVGPAAVLLVQPGPWSFGALASHWQALAAPRGEARTSRTEVELFLDLTLADGWYLASYPTLVADWTRGPRHRWTLPLGAELGRAFELAGRDGFVSAGAYHNALRVPEDGAWQFRIAAGLLFLP